MGGAENYGFGGRLTEKFPSQVIIDITEVCNLACIHCPHPEFKKSSHYGARFLNRSLNEKAVDEVRKHGSQYIRYTAEGEPLIHPEAYEFLDYAVKHSGTFVTLTTNGTILNEKRIQKLLESGLHMVDVSLDAHTQETYKVVRGGNLKAVRENVLNLIRWAKGSLTRVVVSYVEQPQNTHETESFRRYWQDKAEVVIRRLHSAAGGVRWAPTIINGRRPCLYPWERIVLAPTGMLKFCPQDWFGGSDLGDYRETTIFETWNGEAYRKLREAHLKNECFGVCKNCPDWAQTRWPWQGKSYADLVSNDR